MDARQALLDLIAVADDQRDVHWEYRFFDALKIAPVHVVSPEPQQGPDGWPYLMVETAADATEPAAKILHWLSSRGIGMVVNAEKKAYPDFVFPYGMIWHFKETGLFVRTGQQNVPTGRIDIPAGTTVLRGAPSPEYLPDYVRKVLRDFFRDQGLHGLKIQMMTQDQVHYDLVFSVESLGNPPESEYQGIAEAIAWFLPTHYSIMLGSEKGVPGFVDL